ncbi:MAG: hypothetical protein JNN07_20135 [Verrucomicrobiales bacterium]|nr:hypothetical protein [Verrucomicrobiales bacterium]
MNVDELKPDDPELRRLLGAWTPQGWLPRDFRSKVWHRIRESEQRLPLGLLLQRSLIAWLRSSLVTPARAAGCALLFLIAGGTAGWVQARQETDRISKELETRYVHSVAPLPGHFQ